MSKFEDGSYQCLPGPALIAKVLAGRCKMNYTRAAVGQGIIPEDVSPKSLSEPPDYVMDAKIAAVTNPVDGECQVTVQINSSDVGTGFYAMGILLYAEDPDLGEVPYTYLKLEDGMEWIRPASSAIGKLATFDLISAVGAVDAVSANIDPDAIATYAAVKQLIADAALGALNQRHVIATRTRDPALPDYGLDTGGGGEGTAAILEAGACTGQTEVAAIVSGAEYDAQNMSVHADTGSDGTLILRKLEE